MILLLASVLLLPFQGEAARTVETLPAPVQEAVRDGHFALALEMLGLAAFEPGTRPGELEGQREVVLREARARFHEILAAGRRLEVRGRLYEALSYYEERAIDFPLLSEFAELGVRIEALRGRPSSASSTTDARRSDGSFRYELPETASPELLQRLDEGEELEKAGRFEDAARAYGAGLRLAADPLTVHILSGRVEDSHRRLWFLSAVADAVAEARERFREMDWGPWGRADLVAASPQGVELSREGTVEHRRWSDLPLEVIPRILARAQLDSTDRANAAVYLYGRGLEREADRLLAEIVQGDPGRKELVDAILSRHRSEEPPSYGYVWFRERWVSFREREEFRSAEEIDRKLALLDGADAASRRKAFEDLEAYGATARAPLLLGLETRRGVLWERLRKSGVLQALGRVREQRMDLDRRRSEALQLIFDDTRYFYPFRPPECAPEKAKEYPAVQAEVDRRVRAVRELWDSPEDAALSGKARQLLGELQEVQGFLERLGSRSPLPDPGSGFIMGLDAAEEAVGVRSFFWSRRERAEVGEYNRRVLAFNALVETSCSDEEKRQVFLTNQYRVMMGRRALAINERLQRAARGHSKEMESLGYFSHFSPTPARRTPFDRMKLEGYGRGVGENIASGSGAEGVHEGWTHSSGHHRNLLNPFHREMGSGQQGSLWTQNFGQDREFEENATWTKN